MRLKQHGQAITESLLAVATLIAVLSVPINDRGLPDPNGQAVAGKLLDAFRGQHEAWVFALGFPDNGAR